MFDRFKITAGTIMDKPISVGNIRIKRSVGVAWKPACRNASSNLAS